MNEILIRVYKSSDYFQLTELYKQSSSYGGQFDPDRDSEERITRQTTKDPESLLIAEQRGTIVGTVSLVTDERAAWLFRFCVVDQQQDIATRLFQRASEILKQKGHKQVLVYTPAGNEEFAQRYAQLGFTKGSDYTCFWREL